MTFYNIHFLGMLFKPLMTMAFIQYRKNKIYIESIRIHYKLLYLYNNIMKNNNNNSTITSKVYSFSNYQNLQNIAKWKDPRLELVEIPKGLIEVLQNSGFTIEKF
jgi:hypothetical protein